MKKQLIILSFLVASFSLWGMKPQKMNENEAYMGALAVMNNQNLISLKRFAKFDEYAGNYFKETAKKEEREYILDWIKYWLFVMIYYNNNY